jgi:hypothetical protein
MAQCEYIAGNLPPSSWLQLHGIITPNPNVSNVVETIKI